MPLSAAMRFVAILQARVYFAARALTPPPSLPPLPSADARSIFARRRLPITPLFLISSLIIFITLLSIFRRHA